MFILIWRISMATYPKILSTSEINEFDNVPIFNSYDRKVFFIFLTNNVAKTILIVASFFEKYKF